MDFKNFETGNDDVSRRLDKIIKIFVKELSLSEIYKAIRKGLIKVNNHKVKSDYRIKPEDIISVASFLLEKEKPAIKQDNKTKEITMPEIVFENEYILIINKPYNVNVHGDDNSLDKAIENYYNKKNLQTSLSFKPGPLHRLDKKTTGLLAFSMNIQGAHWFSDNIKNHNIKKKYFGIIEGNLSNKEEWKDFIIKDNNTDKGFYKVIARENPDNSEKLAETVITPVAHGKYKGNDITLAEFFIKTGRKHQIRVQSSLHKHPLLGDTAYGSKKIDYGRQDFYLTAKELSFPKENPINLPETISIELPEDFIKILKYCGINKISV